MPLRRLRIATAGRLVVALAAMPMLAACAGGFNLSKVDVDRDIMTGSIAPSAAAAPSTASVGTDEATIRNAVTSADLEALKGAVLPWANVDTGARGAIEKIDEAIQGGRTCRSFTTSRQNFDGVALYRGRACMIAPGAWRMEDFAAL